MVVVEVPVRWSAVVVVVAFAAELLPRTGAGGGGCAVLVLVVVVDPVVVVVVMVAVMPMVMVMVVGSVVMVAVRVRAAFHMRQRAQPHNPIRVAGGTLHRM